MIDGCLRRWTPDDLTAEFSRERRSGTGNGHPSVGLIGTSSSTTSTTVVRSPRILGSHGVPALDL